MISWLFSQKLPERRFGFLLATYVLVVLSVLGLIFVAHAEEKIEGITYTYPDDSEQDPYAPTQDPNHDALFDLETKVWGKWGWEKIIILFDLGKPYQINGIKLWTWEEADWQHVGSFEVYVSSDGKNFTYALTVDNPEPRQENPVVRKSYVVGKSGLQLEARFVKIISLVDKASGAQQQILQMVEFQGAAIPLVKSLILNRASFAPGQELAINYVIADTALVWAEILNQKDELIKTLAIRRSVNGSDTLLWDGTDNNGLEVADGLYKVKLTAAADNYSFIKTALVEVKGRVPAAPQVVVPSGDITTVNEPEATLVVQTIPGGLVRIKVNNMEVDRVNADGQGRVTYKVSNLIAGINQISLSVMDAAQNESEPTFLTFVYQSEARIGQISCYPMDFSPNGDGIQDSVEISFKLTEGSELGVRVVDQSGKLVKELVPLGMQTVGPQNLVWDGQSEGGQIKEGNYRIEVWDQTGVLASAPVAIDLQAPRKPFLLMPETDSCKSEGVVTFSWEGSEDISKYFFSYWPQGNEAAKEEVTVYAPSYQLVLTDSQLVTGKWEWQVMAIDRAGNQAVSPVGSFKVDWRLPNAFSIINLQVRPNPFVPNENGLFETLHIQYTLTQGAKVTATIYNLAGKKVYQYPQEIQGVGDHEFVWDGRDQAGEKVAPGLYVLFLQASNGQNKTATTAKQVINVRY